MTDRPLFLGPPPPVPGGPLDVLCHALERAVAHAAPHDALGLRDALVVELGAHVGHIRAVGTGLDLRGVERRPLIRLRLSADLGTVGIEVEVESEAR